LRTKSLLLALPAVSLWLATAAAGQGTRPSLILLPGEGIVKTGPNAAQYLFGEIEAIEADPIKREFVLRNDGPAPVEINFVQVTCGCASAIIQRTPGSSAASSLPRKVVPGEKVTLEFTVDVTKLAPGTLTKYAYVYLQGREEPAASVQIQGMVLPSVVYKPGVADFGATPYGKGETRRIVALLDSRIPAAALKAKLISTTPSVRVAPDEPTSAEQELAKTRAGVSSIFRAKQAVVRAFTVSVAPDAPIGLLQGLVRFSTPHDDDGDPATPAAQARHRAVAALIRPAMVIAGEVAGDVSASTPTLLFGNVPLGKGATRRVTLTGTTPQALEGLAVAVQGQWVEGRITPDPGGNRKKAVLDVTVKPTTPSLYVNDRVTVTLKNGQRLVIPVSAVVLPGA